MTDDLEPGTRVRIREGLFKDHYGKVVGPGEGPGSLEVAVEVFSRAIPTSCDREHLQRFDDPRPGYRDEIARVVRAGAFFAGRYWWQGRLEKPENDLAAEWREFERVSAAAEAAAEQEIESRLEAFDSELSDAVFREKGAAFIEERWRAERRTRWCLREGPETDYLLEERVDSRRTRARRAAWLERCPDRLEGLFGVIAERAPGFLARLAPGASEQEIAAFRERLGLEVPASFLDLFRRHNGGLRFFGGLELLDLKGVVEVKEMMDRHVADGAFDRWREGEWWSSEWVPFLQDPDSIYDMLCLDVGGSFDGVPGQLVLWSRDAPERTIEAPSFDAWIEILWVGLFERAFFAEEDGIKETTERSHWLTKTLFPGYPRRVEVDER